MGKIAKLDLNIKSNLNNFGLNHDISPVVKDLGSPKSTVNGTKMNSRRGLRKGSTVRR